MPKTTLKSYTIALDIDDKASSAIHEMGLNFKALMDQAKALNFDDAAKSLKSMSDAIKASAANGEDVTRQTEAYEKQVKRLTDDLSKQAVILSHSLTEQGKKERERLAVLNAKQTLTREEMAEQKRLSATVVKGTDEEIKALLARNKQLRVAAKMQSAELRETTKHRKTLKELLKEDLSGITKLVQKYKEFAASLKTTEGRYNALKKAAKVSIKAGAAMAGGVAGLMGAAIGGAISATDKAVSKESALRKMTGPFSDAEKTRIVDQLYIQTGADYERIVAAINAVQNTLGKGASAGAVQTAALQEIKYPGSAALFQSANNKVEDKTILDKLFKGTAQARNYNILANRMRGIQSATGIDDAALEAARKYSTESQLGRGKISQSEVVALYAALKGSNAFDDDATLEKALNSFIRNYDPKKGNIFEQLQKYNFDWFVRGQQNRTQLRKGLEAIDTAALTSAISSNDSSVKMTEAERLAMDARELQQKKDELLSKLIPAVRPIVDKLAEWAKSGKIEELMNGLIDFISGIADFGVKLMKKIQEIVDWLAEKTGNKEPTDNSQQSGLEPNDAQGGITRGPTLVGERGSELVLPLDYARRGRSMQIIQNFSQSFNIAPNPTVSSMAQAVRGSMWGNAFIKARV